MKPITSLELLDTYLRCCADKLDGGTSRDGSFDLIGQWESKQVHTSLLRQRSDPEHLQTTNQSNNSLSMGGAGSLTHLLRLHNSAAK